MVAKPVGSPPIPSPTNQTTAAHPNEATRAGRTARPVTRATPMAAWSRAAAPSHHGQPAAKGRMAVKMAWFSHPGAPITDWASVPSG
jgi:hypothetical protein